MKTAHKNPSQSMPERSRTINSRHWTRRIHQPTAARPTGKHNRPARHPLNPYEREPESVGEGSEEPKNRRRTARRGRPTPPRRRDDRPEGQEPAEKPA